MSHTERRRTTRDDDATGSGSVGTLDALRSDDANAWGHLASSVACDLEHFAGRRGAKDPAGTANATLAKAWRSRKSIHAASDGALRAYLFQIARNEVLQEHRSRKRRVQEELTSDAIELIGAGDTYPVEEVEAAERLLGHLSPLQREVLSLRLLEGYSVSETAAKLKQSESNVRVLQHRSLNKLRAVLAVAVAVVVGVWAYQGFLGDADADDVSDIADLNPVPEVGDEESMDADLTDEQTSMDFRLLPPTEVGFVVDCVAVESALYSETDVGSIAIVSSALEDGSETFVAIEVRQWAGAATDAGLRLDVPGRSIFYDDNSGEYVEARDDGFSLAYWGGSVADVELIAAATSFSVTDGLRVNLDGNADLSVVYEGQGLSGQLVDMSMIVGDDKHQVDLTYTEAGSAADLYAAAYYWDSARRTTVRGSEALVVTGDGWTDLAWFDTRTGHVVELSISSDADAAVQFAESLESVPMSEWQGRLGAGG